MRVLELPAGKSPREHGRIHGESFRGEVKAFSAIRMYLCTTKGRGLFPDRAAVLAAAERHLPVLARYHPALHEELLGIAEGAGVSPAEIVVANHYTDMRDLAADPASWKDAEGGCSLVYARTPTGPILAQTWDMHASAIPYVMMMKLPDGTWVLTLTGCLGLAGVNVHKTAIAINNLNSLDARIGVVWPALVRHALEARSAREARDTVLRAPVGSGHHYFVADPQEGFGIETSGVLRKVIFEGGDHYLHTNHCLDAQIAAVSQIPAGSTTHARMQWLEKSLDTPVRDLEDVWQRLGSDEGWPQSVCTNMATPENPHGSATCGGLAMNLASGEIWAQGGFIHNVAAERFRV